MIGAGARAADALDQNSVILQQAIQNAPDEGSVNAAPLEGQFDHFRLGHWHKSYVCSWMQRLLLSCKPQFLHNKVQPTTVYLSYSRLNDIIKLNRLSA
jgi:hypothetical protein